MAIIATCVQPTADFTAVDTVPVPIAQVLPVPPLAWGFCWEVVDALGPIEGLSPTTPIFVGALYPESPYLEPTLGQIWPRIG